MKKKTVLSGIQPTAHLMLGNYLGALKNWVPLQDTNDCIFCVVDQHAITVPYSPAELHARTLELAATYIASGIDPVKSTIFVQSHVPAHTEMAWLLGTQTWMGELERMTQFKDKSAKQKSTSVGLFYYPVLMAADILLYQANAVPVGLDQKQHLELTRDIAIRMNGTFGKNAPLFVVPDPMIPPIGAKIMSLQEPDKKMSKSDPIPNATVFLSDSDDEIRKKLKKAVTDSGSEITYEDSKAGVKNLIEIQSAILGKSPQEIVHSYSGKQYGHLKVETAEIVVSCVKPIRDETNRLLSDRAELERILVKGAEKAAAIANVTLRKVKDAMGFVQFKS